MTGAKINQIAKQNGLNVTTVIKNINSVETEFIIVRLAFGINCFFIMNDTNFEYNYSHTYNMVTDKITKSFPKLFK